MTIPIPLLAALVAQLASTSTPTPAALDPICGEMQRRPCAELGARLLDGVGVAQDAARGKSLLARTCDLGERAACGTLVNHALHATPQATGDALAFGRKACDLGDAASCYIAADIVDRGVVAPRNPALAATLATKACDARLAPACQLLGILASAGAMGPRDDAKAAALFVQACELDARVGCGDAGGRLAKGWGVAQDHEKAERLLRRGCDADDLHACVLLATFITRTSPKGREAEVRAIREKACQGDEAAACTDLAASIEAKERPGDDPALAARYYQRAASLYERGCADNYGQMCMLLSQLVEAGHGVAQDAARAAELRKRACKFDARMCGTWPPPEGAPDRERKR